MIVVSDTSPITALLTIKKIDLLHQLYGDVKIPPAVAQRNLLKYRSCTCFFTTETQRHGEAENSESP